MPVVVKVSPSYMAWGVNSSSWWGEGEIKFFMDCDGEFPTICGTYYLGGGDLDDTMESRYRAFSTP